MVLENMKYLFSFIVLVLSIQANAQKALYKELLFEGIGVKGYMKNSDNQNSFLTAADYQYKYFNNKFINNKTDMLSIYYNEAMSFYGTALKESKMTKNEIYYYRGQLRFLAEDYYGLIDDSNLVIANSNPSKDIYYYKGHLLLGYAYFKLGKLNDALKKFNVILSFNPPIKEGGYSLDDMLNGRDYWKDLNEVKGSALYYRAAINFAEGKLEQGCKDFSKVTEYSSSNYEATSKALEYIQIYCR